MDLYRDPDNKFVAGFIGSPAMNFLSAVVKNGAVDVPGLESAVDLPVTLPSDGTAVEIGLRPEQLTLDQKAGPIASTLPKALVASPTPI